MRDIIMAALLALGLALAQLQPSVASAGEHEGKKHQAKHEQKAKDKREGRDGDKEHRFHETRPGMLRQILGR